MSMLSEDLWTEEEQSYWLAFDQLSGPGLGTQKVKMLYEHYQSLKPAWHASKEELKQHQLNSQMVDAFVEKRDSIDPRLLLEQIKKQQVQAYPLFHSLYPSRLREIHDPPLVLYVKGKLTPDDMYHSVAVVGTRHPTAYGQRLAKEFAKGLAQSGVTVISGMAVGIDSLAHWGAIDSGGKTVAVLGCGPDVCYPSSNRPLYKLLVEGKHGAVVSEFFPGIKPEPWRFPARNRVISGLSQAAVVIEAGETSGSLITARLAFEQSREVFAVPGRVNDPMSLGTNSFIAKNIAHLVTKYEDVLKEMNWLSTNIGKEVPTVVELYGREREVFELISSEPVHFDYLCEKSGMAAGEMSATLTMLELAGIVSRLPGDWYSKESSVSIK